MPTLKGAWDTICRLTARITIPVSVDPGASREHRSDDSLMAVRATISGRAYESCERIKKQVQEIHRNTELARQETIRKERRAQRKARTLMMRLLNLEQRQEFRQCRYFHVTGGRSGIRYRIRVAMLANIDVLSADGRVKHRLCVHPKGGVPIYDVMAAQLLHLQDPGTEQQFLRKANVHPV